MRSQTVVTFYRQSIQVGPPLFLNSINAHPDTGGAMTNGMNMALVYL